MGCPILWDWGILPAAKCDLVCNLPPVDLILLNRIARVQLPEREASFEIGLQDRGMDLPMHKYA